MRATGTPSDQRHAGSDLHDRSRTTARSQAALFMSEWRTWFKASTLINRVPVARGAGSYSRAAVVGFAG